MRATTNKYKLPVPFHWLGPLGWVSLVVAMSGCMLNVCCPLPTIFDRFWPLNYFLHFLTFFNPFNHYKRFSTLFNRFPTFLMVITTFSIILIKKKNSFWPFSTVRPLNFDCLPSFLLARKLSSGGHRFNFKMCLGLWGKVFFF